MEMEWKWIENGMEMEWKWNGNGMDGLVHGRNLISPLYCGRGLCLSVLKSVSKRVNPKKMKTEPLKKIQKFHFKRPYMYA
jgi:hypothetical protein